MDKESLENELHWAMKSKSKMDFSEVLPEERKLNQKVEMEKKLINSKIDSYVPGLNSVSTLVHAKMKGKGFWDKGFNFGEKLMLIVSELGEAIESDRKGKIADWKEFDDRMNEIAESLNVGAFNSYEEADKYLDDMRVKLFERYIKDSVSDELADVIIRMMDLIGFMGVDIERHITEKMLYNQQRAKKHGKGY